MTTYHGQRQIMSEAAMERALQHARGLRSEHVRRLLGNGARLVGQDWSGLRSAAIPILAFSLASFAVVPWYSAAPNVSLQSISPHELTVAAPAMPVGAPADAF